MKYLRLQKRSRWICGCVFLCLAYVPSLLRSGVLEPAIESGAGAVIAQNGDSLEWAASRMADSLLSNPSFSFDLQNPLNLSPDAGGVAFLAFNDVENTSVMATTKKVTFLPRPNKHTVNIAGYSGATLVKGRVKTNFYSDARQLGIPAAILDSVVKKMSPKLNFKKSVKRGDKFEVIYSKDKQLLYSRVTTKGSDVSIYRFRNENNKGWSYYFANGDLCGAKKEDTTFGKPLKCKITVSDNYGTRRHPISGIIHFHTGVDLAAKLGEPVYAVQDGVVTRASRYGGYGNCIDIQHASGYSSRYAHLSRFKVVNGTKVKKGQLIGYVGFTGCCTGAHLHLELARNDRTMNPFSAVKMVSTKKDTVGNFKDFTAFKKIISTVASKYK